MSNLTMVRNNYLIIATIPITGDNSTLTSTIPITDNKMVIDYGAESHIYQSD